MRSYVIYIYLLIALAAGSVISKTFAGGVAAPQAGSVTITGSKTICSGDSAQLTVTFSGAGLVTPYSVTIDVPGTDQNINFSGLTSTNLNFYVKAQGNYEIVAAEDGEGNLAIGSPGTASINFYPAVSVQMSGSAEICPGELINIPIVLGGNSESFPLSLEYTVNDVDTTELDNISIPPSIYNLSVDQPGNYRIIEVIDNNGCISKPATNSYTINALSEPSALLVGNATICKNTSVPVSVLLEGESPWEISYSINNEPAGTIENITQSPHSFMVSQNGIYKIDQVSDKNCTGDGSGSATINYHPDTELEIVGLSTTYSVNSPAVDLIGLPDGGSFTGPGVITSDSKFYPNLAGIENSPHDIVYAYTDPVNGCFNYDTAVVSVIDSVVGISIENEKAVYCFNDDPITVIGENIENQIGTFTIEGGNGLVDNLNNTATVYPEVLQNGSFLITYSIFDGETTFEIQKRITVEYIEELNIDIDENSFCRNDDPILLEGSVQSGIFSGDGVTGNLSDGFNFDPSLASVGIDSIIYSFTSANGCVRDTFEAVTIYNIPRIDFTVADSCVSERQPSPIQFINLTESSNPVVQWSWNFNDNASGQNNFSILENPTHLYRSAGPRNVSLTAITNQGCESTRVINIPFGDKPQTNFIFETECFVKDSSIQFMDTTISRSAIETYIWKFHDNGNVTISNEENPKYVFSGLSEHQVELITVTEFGCSDTLEKEVFLRPTFNLSEGPYFHDFEDIGKGFWIAEKDQNHELNSWEFGPLAWESLVDPDPTNTTWFTNLEVRDDELSWISSPCFSLEGVEKPFIKLDIWRSFEQTRDGAVLQSTIDNGQQWETIGSIGDGINWYNSFAVPSLPGGIGWTNRIDNNWVESRHRLDSLVDKKNVQFRLVYGSDGTGITNKGFAFDDVWLSTRSKKVLVEHFTNVGDSLHNAANDHVREINALNPSDMIAIQYHLPGPGIDSFHLANPVGPNTRIIKYGLSGSPISIINGKSDLTYEYEDENDLPGNNTVIANSLNDASFSIELSTSVTDNEMIIETETKALRNIANREFVLLLVLVEDIAYHYVDGERRTYYNVFRDFIPDAAGITYLGEWSQNDSRFEEFQYSLDEDMDPENYSVVAFLQDENTNEIVQVETDQDSLATHFTNPGYQPLEFLLYPNPTRDRIHLKLPEPLNDQASVYIFDYTGRVVLRKIIPKYQDLTSVSVESLAQGIYILKLDGDGKSGTAKLIITR